MASKRGKDDYSGVPQKKIRLKTDVDFPTFPERLLNKTTSSLYRIIAASDACYTLTALKICNCNAGDIEKGNLFSNAHCSVLPIAPAHVFGSVFEVGIDILLDYLHSEKIPRIRLMWDLLKMLVEYLSDTESQAVLENTAPNCGESDLAMLLTNHLFSLLAFVPDYKVNKDTMVTSCPCQIQECISKENHGDTSIGNEKVWHGRVDILFDDAVIVEPVHESVEESLENEHISETKWHVSFNKEHIIAETIVNSFLQKNLEPDEISLIPCIGVTKTDLIFYFYDSTFDVLLESLKVPILVGRVGHYKVNMDAILTSWLVINTRYLSNGLTEAMRAKKADFFAQARSKLAVYQENLKIGGIGAPHQTRMSCVEVDNTDPIRQRNRKLFDIMKNECLNRNASEVKYF